MSGNQWADAQWAGQAEEEGDGFDDFQESEGWAANAWGQSKADEGNHEDSREAMPSWGFAPLENEESKVPSQEQPDLASDPSVEEGKVPTEESDNAPIENSDFDNEPLPR
jgi:hypothetical protein